VGYAKMNFDGGYLTGAIWGWRLVSRNQSNDIILAVAKQGNHFAGTLIEEACA